jgi:hypothetical protein
MLILLLFRIVQIFRLPIVCNAMGLLFTDIAQYSEIQAITTSFSYQLIPSYVTHCWDTCQSHYCSGFFMRVEIPMKLSTIAQKYLHNAKTQWAAIAYVKNTFYRKCNCYYLQSFLQCRMRISIESASNQIVLYLCTTRYRLCSLKSRNFMHAFRLLNLICCYIFDFAIVRHKKCWR